MSIYYSNEPRGKGYDTSVGLDIDEGIIKKGENGDLNMYDYDIVLGSNVGLSGSGIVIPTPPDIDIDKDIVINPDGSKSLEKFLSDKSDNIDEMTQISNNGRLEDILNKENSDVDIFNKVINKDFTDLSIKGILEENSINNIFFGEMNTQVIQDTLRYRVYKNTNKIISEQSKNDLFIIMRSVMLQYANFRTGLDDLIEEVKRLNEKVLDYSVKNVTSNLKQHEGYVKDLSQLPVPLDRPAYENKRNFTYDISNTL